MLGWDQLLFQINQILVSDIASEVATEFANNIPLPYFFQRMHGPSSSDNGCERWPWWAGGRKLWKLLPANYPLTTLKTSCSLKTAGIRRDFDNALPEKETSLLLLRIFPRSIDLMNWSLHLPSFDWVNLPCLGKEMLMSSLWITIY